MSSECSPFPIDNVQQNIVIAFFCVLTCPCPLRTTDWQKTEAQKLREKLLLEELVAIVNKRDELVHHLDSQEKAIEEDDLIQREVHNADLSNHDRGCVIQ